MRRLGAVRGHRVDVKLIAITQQELYHRLAVVVLELPP